MDPRGDLSKPDQRSTAVAGLPAGLLRLARGPIALARDLPLSIAGEAAEALPGPALEDLDPIADFPTQTHRDLPSLLRRGQAAWNSSVRPGPVGGNEQMTVPVITGTDERGRIRGAADERGDPDEQHADLLRGRYGEGRHDDPEDEQVVDRPGCTR
ncbi:hypothetical protein [Nonomuraea wenchangensis]|uniref:hypothetical protein n=1 Tax=Nonomuraea wenchangensis TaxID=568860 RepID=UPI0033CBDCA6